MPQAGMQAQYLYGHKSNVFPTSLPYLERVPMEIWSELWSHCESRELRKLALSCRLFNEICRPILFNSLTYWAPFPEDIRRRNWKAWAKKLVTSASRLLKLSVSPHALFVREWDFHGSFELDMTHLDIEGISLIGTAYDHVARSFMLTLYQYANLQTLKISDLEIDEPFLETLQGLSRLESLMLDTCVLKCHSISPTLELRDFTTCSSSRMPQLKEDPELIEILSPTKLKSLSLCCLRDMPLYMASLTGRGVLEQLTHLTLQIPEGMITLLVSFLTNCPFLKSLGIVASWSNVKIVPFVLPPTVIPLLNHYRGPFLLADTFVPGRPVELVELTHTTFILDEGCDYAEISGILSVLSRSSVPLRTLDLPQTLPSLDLFNLIQSLFPQLRELTMSINDPGPPIASESSLLDDDDDESDSGSNSDNEVDDVNYISDEEEEADNSNTPATTTETTQENQAILFSRDIMLQSGLNADLSSLFIPDPRIPQEVAVEVEPKVVTESAVADIELDEKGLPARSPDTFTGMLDWFSFKRIQLPANLEVLNIHLVQCTMKLRYTLAEQRRVLKELSSSLPHLREALLEQGQWRKQHDDIWKYFLH